MPGVKLDPLELISFHSYCKPRFSTFNSFAQQQPGIRQSFIGHHHLRINRDSADADLKIKFCVRQAPVAAEWALDIDF